jgi:hypothetical protein
MGLHVFSLVRGCLSTELHRQALRQAASQVAAGEQRLRSGPAEELQRGLALDTRPLVRRWNSTRFDASEWQTEARLLCSQ